MTRRRRGRDALRQLVGRIARRPGTPPIRFVILSSGRSGSTLLVDLLAAHPQIDCVGELLSHEPSLPYLRIQTHAARAADRGAGAFGFKLLTNQLNGLRAHRGTKLLTRMTAQDWRVIHLVRSNGLRNALSTIHAQQRQYHHRSHDGAWTFEALHADPAEVLRWLQAWDDTVTAERSLLASVPHLDLSYEADLEDASMHQRTADQVFSWLGLPSAPVRSTLTKLTPTRLDDLTDNVEDLRAHLAGTPYARFLDEDRRGESRQSRP